MFKKSLGGQVDIRMGKAVSRVVYKKAKQPSRHHFRLEKVNEVADITTRRQRGRECFERHHGVVSRVGSVWDADMDGHHCIKGYHLIGEMLMSGISLPSHRLYAAITTIAYASWRESLS